MHPTTTTQTRRRRLHLLLLATVPLTLTTLAPAATSTWTAGTGFFAASGNWTPAPPTSLDTALFNSTAAYSVTFSTSPTNNTLSVSAGTLTLQTNGIARTYTLSSSATVASGATVYITGPTAPLTLSVAGGLTDNGFLIISSSSDVAAESVTLATNADASATVDGAGSTLSTTLGNLIVGQNGNAGTLTYRNGASGSIAGNLNLAVSGANNSTASLFLSNAASLTVAGQINLATNGLTGQDAILSLATNSTLTQSGNSPITVGANTANATDAMIQLSSGTTFSSGTGPIQVRRTGTLYIPAGTFNANGNLTVDGGLIDAENGGTLNLAADTTLTVSNGGRIVDLPALNLPAGRNAAISGAGTSVSVTTASVGSASGAPSTLTIADGAYVRAGSHFNIAPTGALNLSADLEVLGNLTVTGGSLTQTAGAILLGTGRTLIAQNNAQVSLAEQYVVRNNSLLILSGADVAFARPTGASLTVGTAIGAGNATVSGPGSTATVASNVMVGSGGNDGTLTLDNSASANIAGSLIIANNGPAAAGTVSILSGADVTVAGYVDLGGVGAGADGTLTVSGPGSSFTQTGASTSIQVGHPTPNPIGTGTINITNGASFSAGLSTWLHPTGTINITDASADLGRLHHLGGTLNFNSGLLTFNNTLTVGPGGLFGTALTLGPSRALTVNNDLTISPNSVLTLDGGTLSVSGAMVNEGAFLFNSGRLNILSSLSIGLDAPFPASTLLGPGRTLAVSNTLYVPPGRQLTLDGAAASVNTLHNSGSVTVTGGGSLTGATLDNDTGASLHFNAGLLSFSAPSINNAGATLVIGPTATTHFTSNLTNHGEIYLNGALATLGGNSIIMQNNGLIRGDGRVAKPLTNNATGELRAEPGKRLKVDTLASPNAGKISLLGGTLEVGSNLNNAPTGTIAGRGTLISTGIANQGTLTLSAGLSDIFGPLTNANAAKTIITGNATATFYNAVTNQSGSEFRVSAGSTAVFLAPVTGPGLFTGTGAKHFESGPSAPAALATQGHTLVLDSASLTTTYLNESSLTTHGPVTLLPNSPASTLGALDLSTTGSLDLANNTLTLTTTPAATVRAYLLSNQIFSSTPDPTGIYSLGYLPTPAGILVKLTPTGDANLDGVLNADDFALLDRGLLTAGSLWSQGDFDYSGSITSNDYLLLDSTYARFHPLSPAFLSQREAQFGPIYVSTLLTSVPEPAALTPLLTGLTLTRRRRAAR